MRVIYASDERFWGADDSQTIQNAVDYAAEIGFGQVIIPRFNDRTGQPLWDLPRAVLLPSDMTIVLDNCHIRHADDTMDNLFRNRNMWTELGGTIEGEQHDIHIIGRGNAWVDGGKHNGIFEQHLRDDPDKYKSMLYQTPITFANVRRVEVRGIRFHETRYWALCFHCCCWGTVSDLHIENSGLYENQDGVNLRIGCEFFTIQNITGWTGDDVVALTALPEGRSKPHIVSGKSVDIHDVTIRNIIASSHGCGLVRMLCENGAREYNITIDNVKDTTQSILDFGSAMTRTSHGNVYCLSIIGQIEGHTTASNNAKTTKYEHVLPLLAKLEESDEVDGVLVVLNTMGGDVEAGLALSEMLASMQKPTVSLVLGGGHSIGVPLATAAKHSLIVPSATMTVHPVRISGMVVGVLQSFRYMSEMQKRIVNFICRHSKATPEAVTELMMRPDQIATDCGSILEGSEAVEYGIIDEVGGLDRALEVLREMAASTRKKESNNKNKNNSYSKK